MTRRFWSPPAPTAPRCLSPGKAPAALGVMTPLRWPTPHDARPFLASEVDIQLVDRRLLLWRGSSSRSDLHAEFGRLGVSPDSRPHAESSAGSRPPRRATLCQRGIACGVHL